MLLDPHTYRNNERSGRATLSPRAVQAAAPVTFQHIGYPDKVESESDILWYADAMHEADGDPAKVMSDDFLVSPDEWALTMEIGEIVERLTKEQFGRAVRPWSAPLFALHPFRMIEEIAAIAERKLTIYEIGPGSGYLGALLIRAGHRYLSTDVAEGFYLWQSRLQEACAPGEFVEMAHLDDFSTLEDPGARVVHVPWWTHGSFYLHRCPFDVDIVMCDHTLGEMSSMGLRYTVRASYDMLQKSRFPLFLTTHIGLPNVNKIDGIISTFYSGKFLPIVVNGPLAFTPALSDLGMVGIAERDLQAEIREFGSRRRFDHPILRIGARDPKHYMPSGNSDLVSAKSAFPIDWDKAPVDYPFIRYIGDAVP